MWRPLAVGEQPPGDERSCSDHFLSERCRRPRCSAPGPATTRSPSPAVWDSKSQEGPRRSGAPCWWPSLLSMSSTCGTTHWDQLLWSDSTDQLLQYFFLRTVVYTHCSTQVQLQLSKIDQYSGAILGQGIAVLRYYYLDKVQQYSGTTTGKHTNTRIMYSSA